MTTVHETTKNNKEGKTIGGPAMRNHCIETVLDKKNNAQYLSAWLESPRAHARNICSDESKMFRAFHMLTRFEL